MKITPTWIQDFETGLHGLIHRHGERITRNLIWDKYVDVRTSTAGRDMYFFLIESMKLHREGQGGNKRFDDIVAHKFEIVNENVGAGLTLTKNEIDDNQMKESGMPMLDYAGAWAAKQGANAARWPQDVMFELLAAGESSVCYDGLPFFSKAHLTNPFLPSGPTFANLLSGAAASTPSTDPNDAGYPGACPIDESVDLDAAAANFAEAIAYIESLLGPDGKPRNLVVKRALAGSRLKKRLLEVTDTKYLSMNGIENVISRYGVEAEVAAEFGASSLDYHLFAEWDASEGGGLIYQNREDYALTSFVGMTQADLARMKRFEWHYDGRNVGSYGHPYLVFKVKAT